MLDNFWVQCMILWFIGSFLFAALLCAINLRLKKAGLSLYTAADRRDRS